MLHLAIMSMFLVSGLLYEYSISFYYIQGDTHVDSHLVLRRITSTLIPYEGSFDSSPTVRIFYLL